MKDDFTVSMPFKKSSLDGIRKTELVVFVFFLDGQAIDQNFIVSFFDFPSFQQLLQKQNLPIIQHAGISFLKQ